MIDGGRPLRILDQILEQYKVVQHGVSIAISGQPNELNRGHLRRLEGTLIEAHQDALAYRSSLLGQRGRSIHA